jgi:truncated hemoglobin YjbI
MIVEEAKQVAGCIGMEMDDMQDPTEFASKLFDKLEEGLQQLQFLKGFLGSTFEGTLQHQNACLNCHKESWPDNTFM